GSAPTRRPSRTTAPANATSSFHAAPTSSAETATSAAPPDSAAWLRLAGPHRREPRETCAHPSKSALFPASAPRRRQVYDAVLSARGPPAPDFRADAASGRGNLVRGS